MGRTRPLPAVARPLRDRVLRRADRGRHHPRERTRDLWQRRQPTADVRHGDLHARHGDLRRLARPWPADRGRHGTGSAAEEEPGLRLQLDVRWRAGRGVNLGGGDGRGAPRSWQSHLPGRHQQPAGRRPVVQGAGLRAAGRQVGGVRLARSARRRQRPAGGAQGLRCRTRPHRGQAAGDPVRHANGQGRALPRDAREEPFHPCRSTGVAASPPDPGPLADRRSPRMNTVAEKKPRLTTSAMIASIAAEGQRVKAAPFGKALVELAANRPEIVGMTADLSKYTDLHLFAQAYPERFYQMGMAEQLLMAAAGGMAKVGLIPFATTYAVFGTRRAYDFIHQVIAEENLNVKICCALPGLTTGYGPSHQATE